MTPTTADEGSRPVDASVDLRAEQLRVGRTRVPVERVRVGKRVVTEVRTIQVEVRSEQLVISREPLEGTTAPVPSGAASTADTAGETLDEITVVLREEIPVVSLDVRPVERVRVSVVQVEGEAPVSEVLSHEEADVTTEALSPDATPTTDRTS